MATSLRWRHRSNPLHPLRCYACIRFVALLSLAAVAGDTNEGAGQPLYAGSTCAAGCEELIGVLPAAAALSGAPESLQAFTRLLRLGQLAGDDELTFCPAAAILVRLAKLYYVGQVGASPLTDFVDALVACDLNEAALFHLIGLSRPQMSYAFWLMSGAPSKRVPHWLFPQRQHAGYAFDIGAGRGDDADFFLALNYSVVAVEGNSDAAEKIRRRPKLVVLHRALVPEDGPATVTFYTCATDPTRSTTNEDLGHYEAWCDDSRPSQVKTVTCGGLIDRFATSATPVLHAKIDVEAADVECLESIAKRSVVPETLSVEAAVGHGGRADTEETSRMLAILISAGYRRFKLCRQALFNPPHWGGDLASSGPFGDVATDWRAGLAWRGPEELEADFEEIAALKKAGGLLAEWFDLHATRA